MLVGLVIVKDVLRFTLMEHNRTYSPWTEAEVEAIIEEYGHGHPIDSSPSYHIAALY